MITLKKQFSREKALVHFCMWDRSDRAGFKKFVGHVVEHLLFYRPAVSDKVYVCWADEELQRLYGEIETRLRTRPETWKEITQHLDTAWIPLNRYLQGLQPIKTTDNFLDYFFRVTDWWTAMTVAFFIPDIEGIPASIREQALAYRVQSEKHTELMHDLKKKFWDAYAPAEHADLFSVVTPEELVTTVRSELPPKEIERIRERLQGYGLFDGVVYPLHDLQDALQAQNVRLEEETVKETKEVRGKTAQPGYAKGTARLVIKKADLVNVRPGDIIVAEMTNPDYVQTMKIASAFVTDEGGTICHAAIVARELSKPCVVGTKIATKIFHDGDLLEVDATNGIVKIIEKNSITPHC